MLERQNKMSDISLSLKVECAFQFFMPLVHSVYSKNLGIWGFIIQRNLGKWRKLKVSRGTCVAPKVAET